MEHSKPYLFVFILFAILACVYANAYQEKKTKDLCVQLSLVIFYVFFAFRGYVYSDWVAYSEFYSKVTWSDILALKDKELTGMYWEPANVLLMCLCRLVSDEYAFLVIVITTIDTYLLLRFLRRWNVGNIPLFLMLMFMFQGVGLMFNALRNQLAIFIFINLIEYIDTRKPLKYFAGCLLALSFHSSAFLFFPLYFFLTVKVNKWVFAGSFLLFFLLYIQKISLTPLLLPLVSEGGFAAEKAAVFTEMFSEAREISISGSIEKFGMVVMIFNHYETLTSKKLNGMLLNCLLLFFFFFYMFGDFLQLSSRLSMLFVFSQWLIWYEVLGCVNYKRLICVVFFMYCCYSQYLNYPQPIQEYDNLLFGAKSQGERLTIYNMNK